MQFILFLLGLFAIGCVLYGISAGVQTVQRGVSQLSNTSRTPKADAPPAKPPSQTQCSTQSAPSSAQRCLDELKELHRLHQAGVLSRDEFEQFKQYLLSTITPTDSHTSKESA